MPQPHPGMDAVTASPRLYGFHATLRPPMRLATGWPEFLGAAERLAAATNAFPLPPLEVADLDGFLALRETAPCPPLHALADAAIRDTNTHRLPPDAVELAKRREAALTEDEEALLAAWGYPYVLQRWRFHLTLTRRLTAVEQTLWRPRAAAHFGEAAIKARLVEEMAVFTQKEQDAPFLLAERLPLRNETTPSSQSR